MDTSVEYVGFKLPHPFIVGAGPLADSLESARKAEDAGAAAIVMRSLFEEQIDAEGLATLNSTDTHAESFGEALSYFPEQDEFVIGPQEYLELVRKMKEGMSIPVFASLNGYTPGGWLDYAVQIEQAGADGLELNLYYVAVNPAESAQQIEQRKVEMVREVRRAVRIPITVKLSPFYTSLAHFACELEGAGADGLVLFNRFFESDLDIEELEVIPRLNLSYSGEILLRLRWLAVLSGTLPRTCLAVTGGVHSGVDAVKAIMTGASAVQVVSALLRKGCESLSRIKAEMVQWMEEKEYDSVQQMRGSMDLAHCPKPEEFARANYARTLQTWQSE